MLKANQPLGSLRLDASLVYIIGDKTGHAHLAFRANFQKKHCTFC